MSPTSSKTGMSAVLLTLVVMSFTTPTASASAATIPEWIIASCPQHADLLRTGGVLDFAALDYVAAGQQSADQRQVVGCEPPKARDLCGEHRCWIANKTVRGQLYSETRCDRGNYGRPMGSHRSGSGSNVPFREMQCVENPKQIAYAFVGKCLGANVFKPEAIASKCRLQKAV